MVLIGCGGFYDAGGAGDGHVLISFSPFLLGKEAVMAAAQAMLVTWPATWLPDGACDRGEVLRRWAARAVCAIAGT